MGTTSFLFLRRVQAVYLGNRFIYWLFWFLWLGSSVLIVLLIPGTHSHHIPGTRHCIVYEVERYVATSSFMPAVFDTLVFFAISYKIAFQLDTGWRALVSWNAFPTLSRVVLQGGQKYYL